jgi:hypothetical protein
MGVGIFNCKNIRGNNVRILEQGFYNLPLHAKAIKTLMKSNIYG